MRRRDLAQHVGHVGVGDRHAVRRLARHVDVGKVDRVGDRRRARGTRAPGRRPSPRSSPPPPRSTRPGAAARPTPGSPISAGARKVAQVVLEPVRAQRRDDGVFVDDRVAREIEQHGARLHQRRAASRRSDGASPRAAARAASRNPTASAPPRCCSPCRTLDGSRHAASTVISGSKPITFMPSLIAVSATRLPIAPRPMTPSVRLRQLDAGELLLALLDLRFEVRRVGRSSAST